MEEHFIFPFHLTQPLPHGGISSAVALIIMFRVPGNYQLSVKPSQPCESTEDEGVRGQQWLTPESKEQHSAAFSPDPSPLPCKPPGLPSRLCPGRHPGNNVAAVISLNEHFILGQCEDVQKSDRVSMYPKPVTLVVSISQKRDTFVTTREPTLIGCY